jgi:3-hydroxymyristoyl/3-hydroxydecanoyl-(acyl carrier protein) dehydratase
MALPEKIIADESTVTGFIPQRPPMVMIGKLVSVEWKTTTTSLLIRHDNIFCHEGIFWEPGIIENIAQTAAAGAGYRAIVEGKAVSRGFIGGIKNLQIEKMPKEGDEILTEVTVGHEVLNAAVVTGKVFLESKVIASCELKIFLIT